MTNTEVPPPTSTPSSVPPSDGTTPPHNRPECSSTLSSCGISPSTFHRTDLGNAELFAQCFKDKVRFDHRHKRWLVWQKHWFGQDLDGQVQRYAKQIPQLRASAAGSNADAEACEREAKWAYQSESRAKLEALLALAQYEHPISDAGTSWDSDPLRLAVENGVVDLRTGLLTAGRHSDRITLHSDIPFDPLTRCPRWERFLREIFNNDQELIDFIHCAVGYSLTGQTNEQALFLCYGTGANGKSTFLDVLRHVLGTYAYNLPFSSFELRSKSAIPSDIAALEGRRFVTALETNELEPLNEARIKSLTGCDPIAARFLYKEWFSFVPVAKFWLAANHKPTVTDDSHGFWRRVRLVPFTQQFNPDGQLLATLKAEAPGILAWALRGCRDWQAKGLGVPSIVARATEEYRKESDPLQEFLDECCELGPRCSVTAGELFEAYQRWAQANGSSPLARKSFSQKLQIRGLTRKQVGHDKIWTWSGIGLQTRSSPPPAGLRADAGVNLQLLAN